MAEKKVNYQNDKLKEKKAQIGELSSQVAILSRIILTRQESCRLSRREQDSPRSGFSSGHAYAPS
jgi:hypothetical protein